MSDADALDRRLRAVERALTDDDSDLTDLRDAAELTREVERLATRLDAVERRCDELDAATQALRGYVGNVRTVNQSVERRADAALAKAESLEATVDGGAPERRDGGDSERPDWSDAERPGESDAERRDGRDEERRDGAATRRGDDLARSRRDRDHGPRYAGGRDGVGSDDEADAGGLLARLAGLL